MRRRFYSDESLKYGSQHRGEIKKRRDKGKARFCSRRGNMASRVHVKELTWKRERILLTLQSGGRR